MVLVHGPGGIGKSTLLRQVSAGARRRAGPRCWWRAGTCRRSPDALDDALAGARRVERPLVLLDSYERMAALGGYLRRGVLPELPDATIVVIAGRRAPEPAWPRAGGRP